MQNSFNLLTIEDLKFVQCSEKLAEESDDSGLDHKLECFNLTQPELI